MSLVRISHGVHNGHVHVSGEIKLTRLTMPFSYKVPVEQEFNHEAHLAEIEVKGQVWEARVDAFTSLRGTTPTPGVTALDCTMYPDSVNDWRLVCVFEVQGQRNEIRLRSTHPATLADVATLTALLAQRAVAVVAASSHAGGHTEKLNAIAHKLQAQVAGL